MKVKKIKDLYFFHPKSKIKAGEGLDKGDYPFFTSSGIQSKWLNDFEFNNRALILGTGGKASLHFAEGRYSVSTDCLVLSSKQEEVNIKFTYYYLNYNFHLIERGFKGAGLEHISKEYVGNIEIIYPDLENQNKIVAILDKVKSILDKREETIQKYSELLRATFIDMFGDPIINPKGWSKIALGKLGEWRSGGTPPRSKPEYFTGNIPWVTSGELNEPYISSAKEHITEEAITISNAKLIKENSILIGMYDTAALKSSINIIPITCNQAIAFSHINAQKCNLLYLYSVLQIGKEYFKRNQRGARQQNLNLKMIKKISVPYPPIELQKEFETRYLIYIELTKKLKFSHQFIEDLYNSLSQLAFKGELEFGKGIDLEVLLDNDYVFFKENSNKKSIQQLLERVDKNELNKNKFYNPELYDKAKSFVFELLKNGEIEQVFDDKTNTVKLKLK